MVVSVPMPLRYWTTPSRHLSAQVHGIIRTTITQFYVNQAVKRGAERQTVPPGSVTFLQRCGGALQLNFHSHVICTEGVFLDRRDQGLTPRFVTGEPPRPELARTMAASLALGQTAEARLCSESGYLSAATMGAEGSAPTQSRQAWRPAVVPPWRATPPYGQHLGVGDAPPPASPPSPHGGPHRRRRGGSGTSRRGHQYPPVGLVIIPPHSRRG